MLQWIGSTEPSELAVVPEALVDLEAAPVVDDQEQQRRAEAED